MALIDHPAQPAVPAPKRLFRHLVQRAMRFWRARWFALTPPARRAPPSHEITTQLHLRSLGHRR